MPGAIDLSFSRFARWAARVTGQPVVFVIAVGTVVLWAATGPFFAYSDTWQLVINTGTTVVTFLMVFLIQNSQNRDTIAVHLKLDELVRAIDAAGNSVLNLDELDEEQLDTLLKRYQRLGQEAQSDAATRRPGSQGDSSQVSSGAT